jgi:hypothetical protein
VQLPVRTVIVDDAETATRAGEIAGQFSIILDRKTVRDGPAGSKIVKGRVTSVGVFPYPSAGRRDLRRPEQVFAEKSLATLRGAPVTKRHPLGDEVTPQNYKQVVIGHIGDTIESDPPKGEKHSGRGVIVDVYLQDAEALREYESGELAEASGGYGATLIDNAGEFEGETHTHEQTNIVYNHVAFGPPGWGRQGPNVRLLDSEKIMIIIDGKEFATEAAAREYIQGKLAAAESALTTEKAEHGKTRAKLADAADPKTLQKAVNARTALLAIGRMVLIDGFPAEGEAEKTDEEKEKAEEEMADKDDLSLKKEIIAKAGGKIPENASADYIEGLYAGVAESAKAKASASTAVADSKDQNSGTRRVSVADEKTVTTLRQRQTINDGSEERRNAEKAANARGDAPKFAFSKA